MSAQAESRARSPSLLHPASPLPKSASLRSPSLRASVASRRETSPPLSPKSPSIAPASFQGGSQKSSSTTSSYGRLVHRQSRMETVPETHQESPITIPDTGSAAVAPPSEPARPRSSFANVMPQPPPRTLDDVRDQVAASTALRAVRKAETVDGTRVGVVLTLSKHEDEKFLIQVAAHVKRVMLLGQYIFAISTSGSPTLPSSMSVHAGAASTMGSERRESMGASTAAGARSPVTAASSLLICGSSAALVHRAVMLACSKFLTRVEEVSSATSTSGGTRWLGLVHSTFASSHSSTYDEAALWDVVRKSAQAAHLIDPYLPPPGARSIAQLLEAARARLARVTPEQAYAELRDAAHPIPVVLVDIRPEAQRLHHGGIHGSLVIERNVLEWRFDPRSDARLSIADRYDLRVIVFCQEGYTSSLAAASLQDLGLLNATDVDGGYEAWKKSGLPTELRYDDRDGGTRRASGETR